MRNTGPKRKNSVLKEIVSNHKPTRTCSPLNIVFRAGTGFSFRLFCRSPAKQLPDMQRS